MSESGERQQRLPSIRDVARLAGVSYQTVSRVLNDSTSIRPETKDRVLDAIRVLDYHPNQAARALVTSKAKLIGILSATAGEFGPSSAIAAIGEAARERGYAATTAQLPSTEPEAIGECVRQLLREKVGGIIVIAPQVRVFHVLRGMAIGVPFVSLQSASGADADTHAADQVEGARLATQHLIDLGHIDIAHIAGPRDWIEAESRMRGYLNAMYDADLSVHAPIRGDWTADFGYFAGRELSRRLEVTAVFAANDLMAIGLMHGFRESGYDVPRDVSVVGFDDIPVSAHVWPPLTTIHQDFGELGRRAVDLLMSEMDERPAPMFGVLQPQVLARSSSAPPRRLG